MGGGKEGKTLVLCHSVPETSPAELPTVHPRAPQAPRQPPMTPVLLHCPDPHPPTPNPTCSPQAYSPGSEGGGGEGGGALLQLLSGGPSPLPSPRCLSHSLRFNSDPDSAPSPPCSQQYMLSRFRMGRMDGSDDECPSSVLFLTRHIQTLKRRVRRFEDQFEQEMNYKPSHNDKYSNPEIVRVMNELAKARKQLKELRLRQSVFESKEEDANASGDRYGAGQQGASEHQPTLEETVESLFRRLREKRHALGLPDNMKEMTQAQMVLEKITLQKCLLYFESLHGRPGNKQEKNLVKPLYDRYQMIKRLLCASPTFSTIEEEDGSDDDSTSSMTVDELLVLPSCSPTRQPVSEEDSDRDSDPAFVSPMDEVKGVRQPPALTMANLHAASRSQLLQCLRETRAEKKTRRKVLREFENEFYRQTGRICQKEDRSLMKDEYQDYKQLKAKLRLLEVLLSKQDVTKPM
ncbi:protein FAM13C-like isoform X2 [Betta splendens]|nr:protein FAM13C-like isoform X2 [Betta splendens]